MGNWRSQRSLCCKRRFAFPVLYIIGAVLVIGAGVFLVTKRRVRKGEGMED